MIKSQLIQQYSIALATYVDNPIEFGLQQAHDMGEQAIKNSFSIAEWVDVHQSALKILLSDQKTPQDAVEKTWDFFKESIIPYEMILRDFQYANSTLQHLYQNLDQTIVEQTQDLRDSEKQYRLLVETMNDGLGVLNNKQVLTYVNNKFCEMLGYSQAEVINHGVEHLFDTHNLNKIKEQLLQDSPQSFELEWIKKDGHKICTNVSPSTIVVDDAKTNFVVVTDITERKLAKETLLKERASLAQRVEKRTAELSRANAELARGVRLKDEFLASMSHELRTPLSAILTRVEILQEQVFGALNDKQLNYIDNIETSGLHLLGLINDILDLSKIEAGKLDLQKDTFDVKNICDASLDFIKEIALQKNLKIVTDIDCTVNTIFADTRRFKQILINLLSNAVKFTPKKKCIGLSVVGQKEQEVIHFTVWDEGIGIAESDMDKLFQSFVQVDSSLARRYEGTGLGLALVRRLTEMHGGSVSVESEVGKGSRFTISLPWKANGENNNNQDIKKLYPLQTSNIHPSPLILLAEDNESNIQSMSDYLNLCGYRVIIARHGKEAIERAHEETPAVILMDIQMPIMDGLEATQHIRADATLSKIPIIALTALAMPGDKELCFAAGVTEYLSKPVHLNGLFKLIEKQLHGI